MRYDRLILLLVGEQIVSLELLVDRGRARLLTLLLRLLLLLLLLLLLVLNQRFVLSLRIDSILSEGGGHLCQLLSLRLWGRC